MSGGASFAIATLLLLLLLAQYRPPPAQLQLQLGSYRRFAAGGDSACMGFLRDLEALFKASSCSPSSTNQSPLVVTPAAPHGASNALASSTSSDPCGDFYNYIIYPPWHAPECAGVLPMPMEHRLRLLYPRRHRKLSCKLPRILVAGCGSGHQVAVELRSHSDFREVVALDLSPKTLAVARRKLLEVLDPRDFERIRFVVGDLLELTSTNADIVGHGFELIVCCGVLHHLPDPSLGLKRLAECLAPGGIIQLSTYSTISLNSWRPTVRGFMKCSKSVGHLFSPGGAEGPPGRTPTPAEVRAFRGEVLALPPGNEVRDILLHFQEFFTLAGILDLLFHVQETSFTLPELACGPVTAANLRILEVHFPDVNAELEARSKYLKRFGDCSALNPTSGIDVERWHSMEQNDPDLFGRMHGLILEKRQ